MTTISRKMQQRKKLVNRRKLRWLKFKREFDAWVQRTPLVVISVHQELPDNDTRFDDLLIYLNGKDITP